MSSLGHKTGPYVPGAVGGAIGLKEQLLGAE